MRFFSMPLVALAVALAVTGCGGGKSASDSDASRSTGTSSSSSTASDSAGKAVSEIPEYPGATTQAAGSGSNMGTDAAGKVMSTADSFDKVYGWYQQKLPSGSERSHIDSPVQTAVFTIGEASTGQSSVTLTTQSGKTMITIAHVKM